MLTPASSISLISGGVMNVTSKIAANLGVNKAQASASAPTPGGGSYTGAVVADAKGLHATCVPSDMSLFSPSSCARTHAWHIRTQQHVQAMLHAEGQRRLSPVLHALACPHTCTIARMQMLQGRDRVRPIWETSGRSKCWCRRRCRPCDHQSNHCKPGGRWRWRRRAACCARSRASAAW